jgi:hypothetical protein
MRNLVISRMTVPNGGLQPKEGGGTHQNFTRLTILTLGGASAETGCPRVETRESFSSDPC